MVRPVRRLEAALEADAESEAKEEAELAETCAVDGKTVRASGDADRGVPCTHIVSVRLTSGLVVGQAAVPDKANELTTNRQLLAKREREREGRKAGASGFQAAKRVAAFDVGRRWLKQVEFPTRRWQSTVVE